jgi:hypothetical protein
MQILLRHARKTPPAPGQPGIFALGNPGVLENLLAGSGFVGIEQRTLEVPLRVPSGAQALTMVVGEGGEVSRSRAPARSRPRGVSSDG